MFAIFALGSAFAASLAVAFLAPRHGVDSRPDFCGRQPDQYRDR